MRIVRFTQVTAAFALVFFSANAADLVVGRGETNNITSDETYDTVTVCGTLNVNSGAKLTATTLELGPNEGDSAVVNVLGSNDTGLKVTSVNVGRSGGTGQIVALSPDATHNTGWDNTRVVNIGSVTICANAAVAASGFIDFLKIGPGTVDFTKMVNSSGKAARILVSNGCLGYSQVQNWDNRTMFSSSSPGSFRVESFDGGDIRFGCAYSYRVLNSGGLAVDANGNDVIFCRYSDQGSQYYALQSGIVWEEVRNIVIRENHPVYAEADDLMPYGPSQGGVIVEGSSPARLGINGTVQHLNSFSTSFQTTEAALSGNAGSKVVFGKGDTDGHLKGRIGDNVSVFKVGTGMFSVTNAAQVGALTISNGTFRVAAPFALSELTVEEDATLVIDGVVVEPSSGTASVVGNVILLNGGSLRTSLTTEEDERIAGYVGAGEWTKYGAGTLILEDPVSMPTNVTVAAGSLAFSAAGYACDLYRWNVTSWNNVGWFDRDNGAQDNGFCLGELAFVDSSGNRIGAGTIASAAIGTSPGELSPGSASFAAGTTMGKGQAGNLFDDSDYPRAAVRTPLTTDEGGVTLYVRLPSDSAPVAAINFKSDWGGCPKTWTLCGSYDGGQTWKLLNEGNFVVSDITNSQQFRWFGEGQDTIPLAFPLDGCAYPAWTAPGVANMPSAMRLEVASGAVADFTNVAGGQTVDALVVDVAAGGGTVKNASFAESGVVFLKNVPQGMEVRDISAQILIVDSQGLDKSHFGRWQICVDGTMYEKGRYRAAYRDGILSIRPDGMVIVVR